MTDMPMKNDNPPSTGLLLALDDLWGDMNPRHDYETCRAKYEALRAGIESIRASELAKAYEAIVELAEIAARAKPNCGPKLRSLIQAAQEKHTIVIETAREQGK